MGCLAKGKKEKQTISLIANHIFFQNLHKQNHHWYKVICLASSFQNIKESCLSKNILSNFPMDCLAEGKNEKITVEFNPQPHFIPK